MSQSRKRKTDDILENAPPKKKQKTGSSLQKTIIGLSQTTLQKPAAIKKRKVKDTTWRPRAHTKTKTNKSSVIDARFSKKTEEKQSVLFPKTPLLTPKAQRKISKSVAKSIRVPFTPPDKISKTRETGTPTEIISKSGNTLFLVGDIHQAQFFSSRKPIEKKVTQVVEKSTEEKSKIVAAPKDSIKKIKIHISKKLLETVEKELKLSKGKRSVSQKNVMKESAAQHYLDSGILLANESQKTEWAHQIAHFILGSLSQHEDNLVATTKESNTEMIIVESIIPKLIAALPNGIDIDVVSHLKPGTHIAERILYTLQIDKHSFPFQFDAQKLNQPHINFKKAITAFFETLLEMKKFESPEKSVVASPQSTSPGFRLVYDKGNPGSSLLSKNDAVIKQLDFEEDKEESPKNKTNKP